MASISSILRLPSLSGSFSGISNALKGLGSSNWFKGALGGLGTFFGFEWLTDGGLVDSFSGTFGFSELTTSIIMIVIVALAIYLAFRYFDSKIPAKRSSSGNHSGNRNGNGRGRSNGGGRS